jgi:hypothetical protein
MTPKSTPKQKRPCCGQRIVSWCKPAPTRWDPWASGCLPSRIPPEHPDPCIYSQQLVWTSGGTPTFSSPDLDTHHGSNDKRLLLLDEVRARVHNQSPRVTATGTVVHCLLSEFGIGNPKTELASRIVSIPPGGGRSVSFALPQAVIQGEQRLAAHIVIEHPLDANPDNNRGSQSVCGYYTSREGRHLTIAFPVTNDATSRREIKLNVLANALTASVNPVTRVYEPGETYGATLQIDVPDALHPGPNPVRREEVTVLGLLADNTLLDGLTAIVMVDE